MSVSEMTLDRPAAAGDRFDSQAHARSSAARSKHQ